MLRRLYRLASSCMFAALVLSIGACSKDPGVEPSPFTQTDADDVIQIVAAMTATNNGGYLTPALAIHGSITWPTGPTPHGMRGLGVNPFRDSTFTRGAMTWALHTVYRDSNDVAYGGFDPNTRTIDFDASANGTVTLGTFLGSTGTVKYGHRSNGFVDSFDGTTSIDFHGFGTMDSGMVTVTNDAVDSYYYVDTTTVIEYNFEIAKSGPAFPDSGEATIAAFIGDLRTANPNDRFDTIDLLITILFDGTETPIATLSENVPDPTSVFRYRINLTTGAVSQVSTLVRGDGGYSLQRRSASQRTRVTAP